jgi:16S rRNA (guanine966-N2)-methyltransferase
VRIIGGNLKGRRFNPPANDWPTRPTTDFAKEGLFNILENRLDFESLSVLDLFGGTGSHSYEFISRGVPKVVYVDKFPGCIAFVKKMVVELKIEDQLEIVRSDVFKYIKSCKRSFDYIFAGPPYGLKELDSIPDEIFRHKLLNPGGLFVLEHNPNHDFTLHPNFKESRNYGTTIFAFFQNVTFAEDIMN